MKKNTQLIHLIVSMALTILIAFLFFTLLFYVDNKYTQKSSQPINGLLSLTQTDVSTMYLIRDWIFFRDKLLTPDDLQATDFNSYSRFINIGQYQGFEMGDVNHNNHGCGTYLLTLALPEQPAYYALELPEIYSSYKLYINGKLYAAMGKTDIDSYQDQVQNRLVTFESFGYTQILIAVADYSYIYSGLVYPPAFGSFSHVLHTRDTRLFIHTVLLFFAFLGAIIGICCAFFLHQNNYAIYSLLSVLLLGYSSYPIFHTFFETSIQPWYSIELLCSYGIYCLTTLLTCKLCDIRKYIVFICLIPSFIFLPITLYLCVNIATLPVSGLFYYSTLSFAYKYLTAFILLCISITSYKRNNKSNTLICATVFFSCALIADRIFPSFEPIYTGWFIEWGGLAIIMAFTYTLYQDLILAYRFKLIYESEKEHLEQQLQHQQNYYKQLQSKIDEARILRHDMRQHFHIIHTLSERQAYKKINEYIEEYQKSSHIDTPFTYCEHDTVNALLSYYCGVAKEQHIDFQVQLTIPPSLFISNTDLSILLGNLIENAIEASLICHKRDKTFIQIKGSFQNNTLIFSIRNYYDSHIKKMENDFLSTKHHGRGIGTHSVNTIIAKYNGHINYEIDHNLFVVSFMIS